MDAALLRLYLITDEIAVRKRPLLETVDAALDGGVTIVQYRCKKASPQSRLQEALALQKLLKSRDIPLVINDDIELALHIKAEGLHIGQKDISPQEARHRLGPQAILGLTVNNAEQLACVPAGLVDYLGIGPVFPTLSKENPAPTLGVAGITQLIQQSPLPVVAIGGITAKDSPALYQEAGAAGIALVSAICGAADPKAAAQAFLRSL